MRFLIPIVKFYLTLLPNYLTFSCVLHRVYFLTETDRIIIINYKRLKKIEIYVNQSIVRDIGFHRCYFLVNFKPSRRFFLLLILIDKYSIVIRKIVGG